MRKNLVLALVLTALVLSSVGCGYMGGGGSLGGEHYATYEMKHGVSVLTTPHRDKLIVVAQDGSHHTMFDPSEGELIRWNVKAQVIKESEEDPKPSALTGVDCVVKVETDVKGPGQTALITHVAYLDGKDGRRIGEAVKAEFLAKR